MHLLACLLHFCLEPHLGLLLTHAERGRVADWLKRLDKALAHFAATRIHAIPPVASALGDQVEGHVADVESALVAARQTHVRVVKPSLAQESYPW